MTRKRKEGKREDRQLGEEIVVPKGELRLADRDAVLARHPFTLVTDDRAHTVHSVTADPYQGS